ncbi:MAG: prepilin-type N-terminal cleavage/methylation domain-containing protein [Candidatus Obscuribacter sp.]|nr:prepilin-type N-terminal cleavage/methylation domain-containing protein [Candidatus Obscuribacter sp.]
MRAGYYQPKRSRSGFSLIEVMISGFLLVLLAVFAADLCLLIFGCSVNDKCCRDVVRAAAQQPNAIKALQFAQASVKIIRQMAHLSLQLHLLAIP